jgi:hypothetical protein
MYTKFVGISAETAALIERLRLNPQESEDDILKRTLEGVHSQRPPKQNSTIGCDLGEGAILHEGEKLYLFRHKASRDSGKPEAIAVAQRGNLHLFGQRVEKSKGSIVQPALKQWQEQNNDRNEEGELVSLNAWLYWYVIRDGKLASAAELRIPKMVSRRRRATTVNDPALVESTVEGVGLDF